MSLTATEEEFECAICRECYNKPYSIQPCQHVFCYQCLRALQSNNMNHCPKCRAYIECIFPAVEIEQQMKQYEIHCPECKLSILAVMMKDHKSACPAGEVMSRLDLQIDGACSQVSNVPNRSTFACPYCNEAHLLREQLIDHCTLFHYGDRTGVVCPICASMPWGDRHLKSSNFMKHLSARHKFDYDTYVDYEENDDTMLRLALQASLSDD